MKIILPLILLCGALALPLSAAVDDTPENRAKEAEKFFAAASPKDLLMEMAAAIATSVPDGEKQKFKEMLVKYVDHDAFAKKVKDVMARHFSAPELAALTEFYSTEVGKSAMKKMSGYTAELMPLVQTEILIAQQKALSSQGGLTALPPGAGKGAPMAPPSVDPAPAPSPAPAPGTTPPPAASPTPPAPGPPAVSSTPPPAASPTPAPSPSPAPPAAPAPAPAPGAAPTPAPIAGQPTPPAGAPAPAFSTPGFPAPGSAPLQAPAPAAGTPGPPGAPLTNSPVALPPSLGGAPPPSSQPEVISVSKSK